MRPDFIDDSVTIYASHCISPGETANEAHARITTRMPLRLFVKKRRGHWHFTDNNIFAYRQKGGPDERL